MVTILSAIETIKNAKLVFWDFDGVIKDSVSVKTQAYEKLFEEYSQDIKNKIVNHHEENGGMSRYEKIPFYFKEYIGHEINDADVKIMCDKFSDLVLDKVINAPWVTGVQDYFFEHSFKQKHILVTGTPQEEIEVIIDELDMKKVFIEIWGAPNKKENVLKNILSKYNYLPGMTIMIGDSSSDYYAARINKVPFLLRETNENRMLQEKNDIQCFKDFNSFVV